MRALVPALLFVALFFAGCDTTDPVPPADPVDVAGVYDVTEFRFIPTRSGILGVNLLDTLNVDATALTLRSDGQFLFDFQFGEAFPDDFRGTFSATRDEVSLTTRSEDLSRLQGLLLDQRVTLERDGNTVLRLDEQRTVDLEAYDEDTYGGIEPQPGRFVLRLALRDAAD